MVMIFDNTVYSSYSTVPNACQCVCERYDVMNRVRRLLVKNNKTGSVRINVKLRRVRVTIFADEK